jgi:hypothetical protein
MTAGDKKTNVTRSRGVLVGSEGAGDYFGSCETGVVDVLLNSGPQLRNDLSHCSVIRGSY